MNNKLNKSSHFAGLEAGRVAPKRGILKTFWRKTGRILRFHELGIKLTP
jgi:hypothetical protein